MGPISFEILSDLYLETHSSYRSFKFSQTALHLALLGDIGHVANDVLFSFLEVQLDRYSVVFFFSWETMIRIIFPSKSQRPKCAVLRLL